MNNIEIICLESEAFYKLLGVVLEKFNPPKAKEGDRWISAKEAMRMLRIKSKNTLLKLRNKGRIRYSQADKKNIHYDTTSILDYLEDFAFETFETLKEKNRK